MTEEFTSAPGFRDQKNRELADELFIVPPRVMRAGASGFSGFAIAWETSDIHNEMMSGSCEFLAITLGYDPEVAKDLIDETDEGVRLWLKSRNCQEHVWCRCESAAKLSAEFVLLLREIWPHLDGKIAKNVADSIIFRRDVDAHRALQSAIAISKRKVFELLSSTT
jgi:hypothetical protein